jgi:hypothetical protein
VKLVIWLTEARQNQTEHLGVLEIPNDAFHSYDIEAYGVSWVKFYKNDLVMRVEEDE